MAVPLRVWDSDAILAGHDRLPKERSVLVREFFRHSWITIRQLDRPTAELAQDLARDNGIRPKDAVHVATASEQTLRA